MHQVRGFSHLAIGVASLDRSLEFYCGLLGLNQFTRYDYADFAATDDDGWDGEDPERSFALVHLAEPMDGVPTPFLSITDRPRGVRQDAEFWNWGFHHFGVWITDYDGAVRRLDEAGVEFAAPDLSSDSFNWAQPAGRQIRTCVVRDPDGNLVQLDELLD